MNTRAIFAAALTLASIAGAKADFDPAAQFALGNPSGAVHDARLEANYLISRNEYALAYSRYDGICRWVSWHLNASDLGSASRGSYTTDTSLPAGWYEVTPSSGWSSEVSPYGPYDRGHMCPSADRTANDTVNDHVFLMTNLVPQSPNNNQGPWEKLEAYCRTLVQGGDELYIVCGPRGYAKGTRITSGHVSIPAYTWKIVVVLPDQAGDDVARINANTRVIAVDMMNSDALSKTADWHNYRVSVADLEARTGLHFLTNVPVAVRNALRAKVDTVQ